MSSLAQLSLVVRRRWSALNPWWAFSSIHCPSGRKSWPTLFLFPWLKELQTQQLEAREYEFTRPRWRSRGGAKFTAGVPLFESIVSFVNYPGSDAPQEDDDQTETSFRLFENTDYPLNFMVIPARRLDLKILFNQQRFDAAAITRMLGHLQTFLEGLVADSDRRLGDIPLLTRRERRQIVADWNSTRVDYPSEENVVSLFEAQVARTPEATAFVCEGAQITYAELNSRSNRLARHLQALGVGPEVLVGICIDRSFDFMVALLATFKAGGAYLPLDPGYPKERLAFMVEDARVNVLLTLTRHVPELPVEGRTLFRFDVDGELLTEYPDTSVTNRVSPQQLAYVIYTSGSTGQPKGVMVEHAQLLNRFYWMWREYPFAPGEVGSQKTAANFVDSIWEFFGPLLKGIPTVIIRDEVLRDASRLVEELACHRVTRIWLVPSLLSAMLDLYDDLQDRLPSLRFWVTSGEALTPALFQRFRERMPFATLYNLYGTSEVWDATWFDPARETIVDGQAPIGRPIYNVQVYVLDERLQPVPVGVAGELYVGGIGLARGYLNRPELTAAKFIPDPFSHRPDARLYKTSDLARYLSDGNIEYLGRLDRQVKIRGFRIEPGEVEGVLSRHPGVRKAVVIPRQDASREPFLAAYVVRNLDYDGSELRQGVNSWSAERARRWQEVWDEIYSQTPAPDDPTLNLGGWTSSYTGLPIPADEMFEWTNRSVESVLSLKPDKVLEIGCGAGLLLFRIAPHCARYCGTDFSPSALRYVGAHVGALNLLHVDLLQRAADDFTGFDPGSFDVVILNSVTQYFPTIDYLLAVLEGALGVLRPGGAIYVGAVRSLPLLEAFHASVELRQASALLSVGQLRQRIRKRVLEEDELAIDPAFFHALRHHFPQIGRVQVAPKRGRFQNELTRFRYEVVLHVTSSTGQADAYDQTDARGWSDWRREQMSLPAIRQVLREGKREMLRIARIPNGRLVGEMNALELLASLDERDTVGDLRDALRGFRDVGVDPEDLWELQEKAPYSVQLQCSALAANDCFHALICRRGPEATAGARPAGPAFPREDDARRPWNTYANNPLQRVLPQVLVPELRRFAQTVLPDHMVPATFVLLDSLPLTPSGKVDFAALPAPDRARPERKPDFVAPRTRTERMLASTWTELLGVDQVGAHDNFFELGGHSLVAIRLLSRMREAFQLELPLRAIFESPTLAGLAQLVEDGLARGEEHEVSAIVRLSRDAHAATMLPGGVLDPTDLAKGRHTELPHASPGLSHTASSEFRS